MGLRLHQQLEESKGVKVMWRKELNNMRSTLCFTNVTSTFAISVYSVFIVLSVFLFKSKLKRKTTSLVIMLKQKEIRKGVEFLE